MMNRSRSFSSTTYALALRLTLSLLLLLFIANSLTAATGISLVQHKGLDAGTNTTASLNFPSANTAGNFIAVVIRGGLSSSQVFTVKDSSGNTYKKAVQIGFTASAVTSAIYYAENIKGGANTVTVSMTVNGPLRFAIMEYSGVATSNSLDATAAATGTGTAASSGNTTTTVSGDLLLGSVSTVNGATFTAGTGYVIRDYVPNESGTKLITEDRIQSAAGIASATATLAASDTWGALLAAFKAAGGVAVPSITNLSPSSGPAGTSVTITGTNFGASQGTSTVAFNGTTGAATTWSNTSIVVPVPSSATSGNVVVSVGGQASSGVAFTVIIPPSLTSLSPTAGPVGTSVTISGNGFGASQGNSTVSFNGTAATATSWSATSIVTFVPNGATSGNVVVRVGGLASNGVAFAVTPSINSISPSSGPAGTSVTITGTNFGQTQSTSSVMFGSSTATVTGWSNTSVVAIVPGNLSAFTNVPVQVVVSGATSNAVNFAIAPSITSVSPTSGPVGSSVTITGTNFASMQGSTITFNGTAATPTSWSATSIVVPVPNGATTGNVVVTVGGLTSNGVNFSVTRPPPPPSITTVSPSSAIVGGGQLTITVTGTNFVSSAVVQWNGNALATTFLSSTQLQATVTSSNISSAGAAKVTVSNTSAGGVSNSSTFFVGTTGGSNFATIVVNQAAKDIVYDPKNQVFYLSVPGTASINPNTIAVLDPTFAAITSAQPAGSNPNVLAISDDSQFLCAGIDGTSTVQRFVLPGLAPDISYPLGTSQYFGPYFALDLQVAPGAPHTLAVTLGTSNVSPAANGGITIFDDATARPTKAPGFGGTGNLFDSLQWGPNASTLFASNTESTGYDFYTLSVNSNGVALNQDFPSTFTRFGDSIHFDPGTNLIYSDEGHVINPSTGLPVGNFNATGVAAVDSMLNTAFFASGNAASTVSIESFDLMHFTPINTVTIPNATGTPLHLIRWGQNGLAFISKAANGTSQVVLLGGDFVTAAPPYVLTPPPAPLPSTVPAPNAPAITSLNPSSATTGSGPFMLNVTGTQFDPAATVQFNGNALSTTYVSATQLQALIPASDVVKPGSANIVVANPAATGGSSAGATFFVGSAGGTSSPGAGFAFQVVNQVSKDIGFDRVSQRFYLSVPNSAATGNTIVVLDPATTTIVGQQFAGSNPDILSISDDGQFLYAGIDGSASVQRFTLPGLGIDVNYSLGAGAHNGPYFALDLQVAPASPHTTAVTLAVSASSPSAQGGITIFDDTAARPTIAKGFGPGGGGSALYDALQWGVDATALFAANNESSGFDFYSLSVTSSGVSLMSDFQNTFSSFYNKIHFDPGTNLVYSDDGHAVNPTTGASVGTFSITGLMRPIMVPDSGLNLAFFAAQTGYSSVAIYSYNLSTFAPVGSITISNVNGNPIRLIRWGQNGLAFNTDAGQIVLVGGNFVH
jgi:hypothetical protein